MNYFEWFSLPISFSPDQAVVKSKFYELSKKYHPDFYINQPLEKQEEILEQATFTNKAYQTLSKPELCLPYVLSLKGLLQDGEQVQLPPDFLLEMMEINEALMELEFEADVHKLTALEVEIGQREAALAKEFEQYAQDFDIESGMHQVEALEKIKDAYFRQKYVLRIRDSLNRFASR
jgi:molecular chaperone HscB